MSPNHDNMTDLNRILSQAGLDDHEIAVYLASLATGARPASVIAKGAQLKRGHTYNVLGTLLEKGIMQEFLKEGVRHFVASDPKTLLTHLDHRTEELKSVKLELSKVIPLLARIQNPTLSDPIVRYYRGVAGIKEVYEDTLREPQQPIYAVADFASTFPEDRNSDLHQWMWNYAQRRADRGIHYRGIVCKSAMSDKAFRSRKKQKRILKMVHNVALPVEINVYGNKVAMMSTSADMIGVIIEHTHIAETLRNFHQAVWEFLPDYL